MANNSSNHRNEMVFQLLQQVPDHLSYSALTATIRAEVQYENQIMFPVELGPWEMIEGYLVFYICVPDSYAEIETKYQNPSFAYSTSYASRVYQKDIRATQEGELEKFRYGYRSLDEVVPIDTMPSFTDYMN